MDVFAVLAVIAVACFVVYKITTRKPGSSGTSSGGGFDKDPTKPNKQ